jgi:hypothetical protein
MCKSGDTGNLDMAKTSQELLLLSEKVNVLSLKERKNLHTEVDKSYDQLLVLISNSA